MDSIDDRLLALKEKKLLLDDKRSKLSKPPRKKKQPSVRGKKKYIREHFTKDLLKSLKMEETHFCDALELRLQEQVCLARVFLEGHARHKKCIKCTRLDKYIDLLIERIKDYERESTLSIEPENTETVQVQVCSDVRGQTPEN